MTLKDKLSIACLAITMACLGAAIVNNIHARQRDDAITVRVHKVLDEAHRVNRYNARTAVRLRAAQERFLRLVLLEEEHR